MLNRTLPRRGGFALDLALAHAIQACRQTTLEGTWSSTAIPPRPVFVIVGKSTLSRTIDLSVAAAWLDVLPQLDLCEVGADGTFRRHTARGTARAPLLRLGQAIRPLSDDHALHFPPSAPDLPLEYWAPEQTSWKRVPQVAHADPESPWSRAAGLLLVDQDHARSLGTDLSLGALVQASRAAGILVPATSYIVVENEAQWRMLDRVEAQKLGQNAALEFLEAPAPPALLVAAGFLVWIGWRRWRRRRAATA